jgi:hypothetical protein
VYLINVRNLGRGSKGEFNDGQALVHSEDPSSFGFVKRRKRCNEMRLRILEAKMNFCWLSSFRDAEPKSFSKASEDSGNAESVRDLIISLRVLIKAILVFLCELVQKWM